MLNRHSSEPENKRAKVIKAMLIQEYKKENRGVVPQKTMDGFRNVLKSHLPELKLDRDLVRLLLQPTGREGVRAAMQRQENRRGTNTSVNYTAPLGQMHRSSSSRLLIEQRPVARESVREHINDQELSRAMSNSLAYARNKRSARFAPHNTRRSDLLSRSASLPRMDRIDEMKEYHQDGSSGGQNSSYWRSRRRYQQPSKSQSL